jgi:hypothetical protein
MKCKPDEILAKRGTESGAPEAIAPTIFLQQSFVYHVPASDPSSEGRDNTGNVSGHRVTHCCWIAQLAYPLGQELVPDQRVTTCGEAVGFGEFNEAPRFAKVETPGFAFTEMPVKWPSQYHVAASAENQLLRRTATRNLIAVNQRTERRPWDEEFLVYGRVSKADAG